MSAHENDEGCAPDGGGGFRVPVRIRSPLLNPPPVVEEARRRREEARQARRERIGLAGAWAMFVDCYDFWRGGTLRVES